MLFEYYSEIYGKSRGTSDCFLQFLYIIWSTLVDSTPDHGLGVERRKSNYSLCMVWMDVIDEQLDYGYNVCTLNENKYGVSFYYQNL